MNNTPIDNTPIVNTKIMTYLDYEAEKWSGAEVSDVDSDFVKETKDNVNRVLVDEEEDDDRCYLL